MRPMAKNDPFIHQPYTLCVLCVLRGEFFQCTYRWYDKCSFPTNDDTQAMNAPYTQNTPNQYGLLDARACGPRSSVYD